MVYLYIPAEKVSDVVDCGLKLSEWLDRMQVTPWNSSSLPCICALLHPNDDSRSKDSMYQCIKLNIPTEECFVADGDLYELSLGHPEIKLKYIDTMVPLNKYMFGSFRKPECLIFTTVLPEQISIVGKGMDDPVLYESSQQLYVNNLLERYNDRYSEINQVLLYCFLMTQTQNGVIEGFYSNSKETAIFFDRDSDRYITIPVPNLKKYRLSSI